MSGLMRLAAFCLGLGFALVAAAVLLELAKPGLESEVVILGPAR